MPTHKGGKKGRKHGNNVEKCKRYRNEGRKERNAKRRLISHLRHNSKDVVAQTALSKIGKL